MKNPQDSASDSSNAPAQAADATLSFPEKFAEAVRMIYARDTNAGVEPDAFEFSSGVTVKIDCK